MEVSLEHNDSHARLSEAKQGYTKLCNLTPCATLVYAARGSFIVILALASIISVLP